MAAAKTVQSSLDTADRRPNRAPSTAIAVLLACVLLLSSASTPAAGRHGAASHTAVAPGRSLHFSAPPRAIQAQGGWRHPLHRSAAAKPHLRRREEKGQTFGKHPRRERRPAAIPSARG